MADAVATAEVQTQNRGAVPPSNQVPEIYMMVAAPRRTPKPLPIWPNPAPRPEGSLEPLILNFVSPVLRVADAAQGRMPKRDTAAVVQAVLSAGNRSIHVNIDDAGGDAEGGLHITAALLRHGFSVRCRITGNCSSMAAAIALSADARSIIESGRVLLHRVRYFFTPTQYDEARRLPAKEKREIEGDLNDFDDAQVALLMLRLGVSEAVARLWLREEKSWTAVEALSNNFVHTIDADAAPANTEAAHGN